MDKTYIKKPTDAYLARCQNSNNHNFESKNEKFLENNYQSFSVCNKNYSSCHRLKVLYLKPQKMLDVPKDFFYALHLILGVFFCDSLDLCYNPCHVIKHES